MSHPLSPTAVYTGDVTVPDSGDARNAASVNTPIGTLADRAAFALDAARARIVWAEQITVEPGGTSSVFEVTVGPIFAAVLPRADGSWRVLSSFSTTLTADHVIAGGTLPVNTWLYVFVYDDAGTLAFEIATTAPSSSSGRTLKTGDSTRRYLACFRTDGSGAPIAAHTSRGVTTYTQGLHAGYVSVAGPTLGWTALSLAASAPPWCRSAVVTVNLTGDAQWRSVGDAGGTSGLNITRPAALSSTQTLEWSSASVGSINATVRSYIA